MKYQIITSTEPGTYDLTERVNGAINNGWAPVGGPFKTEDGRQRFILCQAMIKPAKPQSSQYAFEVFR